MFDAIEDMFCFVAGDNQCDPIKQRKIVDGPNDRAILIFGKVDAADSETKGPSYNCSSWSSQGFMDTLNWAGSAGRRGGNVQPIESVAYSSSL